MQRIATTLAAAAVFTTTTARTGDAHPLHTTLAEVRVDVAHHSVRATIRLFADDLSAALATSRAVGPGLDARAAVYVASTFSLTSDGRAVPLRSCGVRRSGDLLWVCLENATPLTVNHLRARNSLLVEAFSDQVNIVQIGDGPSRRSVLFLKGDRDKPLVD